MLDQQTQLLEQIKELFIEPMIDLNKEKTLSTELKKVLLNYIIFYAHFLGHVLTRLDNIPLGLSYYLDELKIPHEHTSKLCEYRDSQIWLLYANILAKEINNWFNSHQKTNPLITEILNTLKSIMLNQINNIKDINNSWVVHARFTGLKTKETDLKTLSQYYQKILNEYFLNLLNINHSLTS